MTKVPLRAYLSEIQEAIEQKQTEEAIAHCRHILQTFPKHIDTYRLLGKAYLESQRYSNAADIFQRVLSSVPDDFVSHVGMSIIREDETNLDAAIWHMERAYESQPYNNAILGELRRLFGRRDGSEPPKIRLTRGALARMYSKGNLHDQAIAELRAALAKDPQRADLQILLAKSYVHSGKQPEAIEVCSSLLQRFPYCLEANRLLAELLPENANAEEMQICRQRIQALDPYEAFVSPQAPTADDVPSQAITLYRLEWDGGPAMPQSMDQPEWATSIGVSLGESDSDDEGLPDWLSSAPREESATGPGQPGLSEESGDEIPGWMQEAGWGPSTGAFDESKSPFVFDEEEAETGDAVAADIPAWLQEMAPADIPDEADEKEVSFEAASFGDDLPDWLHEEADGASETIISWLDDKEKAEIRGAEAAPESAGDREETPDWLEEIGGAAGASGAAAAAIFSPDEPESEEEVPDWLKEIVSEESAGKPSQAGPAEESEADELPDWLQDLDEEAPAAETQPEPLAEEEPEDELGELPDWLAELQETESQEAAPPAEAESEAEAAEVPDWLQGLGGEEPEDEPGLEPLAEAEPEAEAAEVPDWLQGLGEEIPEKEPEAELEAEAAELPDWLQGLGEETPEEELEPEVELESLAEAEPEAEAAELPDWLQGLGDEEPEVEAEPEPLAKAEPEAEAAELPDWLQGLGEEEPEDEAEPEPLAEAEPEAEAAELPDWLQGLGEEEPEEESEPKPLAEAEPEVEAAELPDWLQGLGEEEPEPEAEPEPPAEAESEAEAAEVPDWLQGLGEETPEAEPEAELEAEAAELPDWLQGLGEEEPEEESEPEPLAEAETEAEAAELPDWLQGLGEETPEVEPEPLAEAETEAEAAELPDWLAGADETAVAVGKTHPLKSPEDETPAPLPEEIQEDEPVSEQAGMAAGQSPDEISDLDEAMAWLESLAAKQGVSEEELLTSPEERSDSPPAWVQGTVAESQLEPEAETDEEDEFPEWLSEIGEAGEAIPEPEAETPALGEIVDASAAIAWLESLDLSQEEAREAAEDAPAQPQSLVEETVEMVAEVEEDQPEADFPEWLAEPEQEAEEVAGETALPEPETETNYPDWLVQPEDEPDQPEILQEEIREEVEVEEEFEFADADAAMAWLEGLASKQGVSEEELLTSPDERSETPPDWVQAMVEEESPVESAEPIEEPEAVEPEPAEIPSGLSESQAEVEVEAEEPAEEEELEPEPDSEEIPEDIPNWLRETIQGEAEFTPEVEEATLVAEAESLEEPAVSESAEMAEELEVEIPLDETEPLEPESEESAEVAESPEVEYEPPSWVVQEEAPEDDEYAWLTPEVIGEISESTETLLNINQASLIQLERLPNVGFRRAQAIVAYRDEHGEFKKLEDLLQIPDIDMETLEGIRSQVIVTASAPEKPRSKTPTGPLVMPIHDEPPQDQYHAQQVEAQIKLAEGDIDGALAQYGRLIKKGKRLDGIIEDLNQALYQVPMDVSVNVLQTLGDAYMRAGQLQDALDMYTKAEELLR